MNIILSPHCKENINNFLLHYSYRWQKLHKLHLGKWNNLWSSARISVQRRPNWKGCGYAWKTVSGYTNIAKNHNLFTPWRVVRSIFLQEMAHSHSKCWFCNITHYSIISGTLCSRCRLSLIGSFAGESLKINALIWNWY